MKGKRDVCRIIKYFVIFWFLEWRKLKIVGNWLNEFKVLGKVG